MATPALALLGSEAGCVAHDASLDFLAHLSAWRGRVDAQLATLLPASDPAADPVGAAMRYAALAPGKRVRPLLLLLAAEDLGSPAAELLDLACALELVHAASLVVDDLPCMDDAQLRRGQPTVHVRHGQDVAILAAIGLLGLSFRLAATTPAQPAQVRACCTALLAEAVGPSGLVQGQYRDLHAPGAAGCPGAIAQTNQLKTGALFTAALGMAAAACHAQAPVAQALQGFADELGQAFQLQDDLGDMTGTPGELGKDVGRDIGRQTLPALLGIATARELIDRHLASGEAQLAQALGPDCRLARFARLMLGGAPPQAAQP